MRNAHKLIILSIGAAAMAACGQDRSDQNIAIDNDLANADIETLPPDESSATPTGELVNGAQDAEVNEGNLAANAY